MGAVASSSREETVGEPQQSLGVGDGERDGAMGDNLSSDSPCVASLTAVGRGDGLNSGGSKRGPRVCPAEKPLQLMEGR